MAALSAVLTYACRELKWIDDNRSKKLKQIYSSICVDLFKFF
jgi:hypothetical protein